MKKITAFLFQLLLFAGSISCAQTQTPVQERWIDAAYVKNGSVDTGNSSAKLAVRSGPGKNYSQVGALSSGQQVTSDKVQNGWIRIAAGSDSAAPSAAQEWWINAAYVKNGLVDTGNSSAKLAVRSGPGAEFSQINALSAGQEVTVSENKNGWVRIVPTIVGKKAPKETIVITAPGSVTSPSKKDKKTLKNQSAVAVQTPAPEPIAVQQVLPRPVPVPVRPPVDNLILSGDFTGAALALPAATGDSTAELSGRWLRSVNSAWEISPFGGNLGSYVRAAASREAGRLLYVANDAKRSKGSYALRFDYILADPSDVLGVKVFVSDSDITIGTDGGNFKMNNSQRPNDMVILPAGASWATYYLPVELSNGYNYIYVLFVGSGAGNTGIDNVSLSPQRH